MTSEEIKEMADRFLDAWNTQDVEKVVATYTDDVTYVDPNTRGAVEGSDSLRRYLRKLFDNWQMHWEFKEGYPLQGEEGAAVLWHASFRKNDGDETVEADGMDLIIMDGDRIKRNEVYFDRAVLAPLLAAQPA